MQSKSRQAGDASGKNNTMFRTQDSVSPKSKKKEMITRGVTGPGGKHPLTGIQEHQC